MSENSIPGKIEVGDIVRTLNRRISIEGHVTLIKKGRAFVTGATYPGGPETKCEARLEDLALKSKGSK